MEAARHNLPLPLPACQIGLSERLTFMSWDRILLWRPRATPRDVRQPLPSLLHRSSARRLQAKLAPITSKSLPRYRSLGMILGNTGSWSMVLPQFNFRPTSRVTLTGNSKTRIPVLGFGRHGPTQLWEL